MSYRDIAEAILADSGAVARDLQAVHEGTTEAAELHAEAQRLRAEYRRLVEEVLESHRRPPPPFPTAAEAEPN